MADTGGLRSLREFNEGVLFWIQPVLNKRYFELVGEGRTYATLHWEHESKSLAIARFHNGVFTFKRAGFLMPHVTVRRSGEDGDFGRLRFSLGGSGLLELHEGRSYRLLCMSSSSQVWAFVDNRGSRLCTFVMTKGIAKRCAEVTIEAEGRRMKDIAVIVLVGWYFLRIKEEEELAAAAAAASWPFRSGADDGGFMMMAAAASAGAVASIPPPSPPPPSFHP